MNLSAASLLSGSGQEVLLSSPFAELSPVTRPVAVHYRARMQVQPWPPVPNHRRQLLAVLDALPPPDVGRWPNAVPPDPGALRDARTFILSLPLRLVHLPDIGLADDGEVNFLWNDGGLHCNCNGRVSVPPSQPSSLSCSPLRITALTRAARPGVTYKLSTVCS